MRTFIILKGLPASGKSTFIKEHNLERFTISTDALRLLAGSTNLNINGEEGINNSTNPIIFKIIETLFKERFKRGTFTIYDATNLKNSDIRPYIKLAKSYKYRCYILDFTDVPASECIRRNKLREEYKRVPDFVFTKMIKTLEDNSQPIGGVKVIKPEDFEKEMMWRTLNLDKYKKIHHIGDIHGCYTVLKEYLKDGIKDDEFYIFLGDFIDRGIENVEVLNFIHEICRKENVILLEGNHEIHLHNYVEGNPCTSHEFETFTQPVLEKEEGMRAKCRDIYSSLSQALLYTYADKTVLVCHGGISNLPSNLLYVPTEQLIKGTGKYEDVNTMHVSFMNNTDENTFEVHGHRNPYDNPIVDGRCFNLCSVIEYGGNLRVLTLTENGFEKHEIPNTVYKKSDKIFTNVKDMIDAMDNSNFVNKKQQPHNSIYAYNFKKSAFFDKIWDSVTTKARGLFIDTENKKIVARGFNKFFNIGEMPETKLETLKNNIKYPLTAYLKVDGFLGLVSYNEAEDDLFICSKSETDGTFSKYFQHIVAKKYGKDKFKNYIKRYNTTFVFEVVDPVNDSHIIKYKEQEIILLDVIPNTIKFNPVPYDKLCEIANDLGVKVKEKIAVLKNNSEFEKFYNEITAPGYKYNGEYIEGFVFVTDTHFMFKQKTNYYLFWKSMKNFIGNMLKGYKTQPVNEFEVYITEKINTSSNPEIYNDILKTREEFLNEHATFVEPKVKYSKQEDEEE